MLSPFWDQSLSKVTLTFSSSTISLLTSFFLSKAVWETQQEYLCLTNGCSITTHMGVIKKKDEWLMLHVAISEMNCKDEHQLPSDHLLELSYMTMIPSSIVFIAVVKPKDSLCFDTVIIMHFRLSELTWNWFCLRSKARVLKCACHKEEAFNNLMALNAFNYSVADWKWPLHGK